MPRSIFQFGIRERERERERERVTNARGFFGFLKFNQLKLKALFFNGVFCI